VPLAISLLVSHCPLNTQVSKDLLLPNNGAAGDDKNFELLVIFKVLVRRSPAPRSFASGG
jgi:hypothetical protein